ncbi:MAG TPA: pyruvate formate-lyase-activating protein [Gemmatales bacterium]|nr:pyruvate formate-lyase-activating protein [Gemmatales bacterium]
MSETTKYSLEAKNPYELRVDMSENATEAEVKAALATGGLGYVHSFTTGSCVDGPGVRVVVWLTGCHFRCIYCHNPDTWKMKNGMPVTLDQARQELSKYSEGLKIMKGGLTISGGEPLLQDRFVVRFCDVAKELGVHTTLDTNGHMGSKLSDEELERIDLVMWCIKAWDNDLHKKITGMENGPAREFARRLASNRRPMWLRYVLLPGVTDNEKEINEVAHFAAKLGNVERVDLLPFHQMGEFKWDKIGMTYSLHHKKPPTEELIQRVRGQFQAAGLITP